MPPPASAPTGGSGEEKNSRSPGWRFERSTCGTAEYCATEECGSDTPTCAHAHIVRPLQSNPVEGLAPAQTYGVPITDSAACTAPSPPGLVGGAGLEPPPPVG